ncbi:CdaR family transcriptional regulator [Halomonas litopenaei]|nr:CdaR family transcriptional regulator [Halomonas litopenaei]
MILSAELAQQIIDKTQDILDANINVMDARGVIIASGDHTRLGTLHDGAVLALKHGRELEISENDVDAFKGARPGINLLLQCAGKTVGVLGITGSPPLVRQAARLVKVTAEMLVEQADMLSQLEWAKRHREGFILSWVNAELSLEQLHDWAERLGIDVACQRLAVLIELDRGSPSADLEAMQRLMALLAHDRLVTQVSPHRVLLLQPVTGQAGRHEDGALSGLGETIDVLLARLARHALDGVKVAVGRAFNAPGDLHLSFESARQVLAIGKRQFPERSTYHYDELRLPVLLSPLSEGWQGEQLREAVERIRDADSHGRLLKTLAMLIEHEGNLSRCADALHVHRNTLRYRLDRIHEITGISPHCFTGLVELFLGLELSSGDGAH